MTVTTDTRAKYHTTLQGLSEASVSRHFDAFTDVPWDDPEYAIVPNDPRWVLPTVDALGATDWYQSLPLERQIHIGMYRQASMLKVGLQFEQILISGLMNYALKLPNGSPEFRYATHEATEETHHTQMFQELVNRIGMDVDGGPAWFKWVVPQIATFSSVIPFGFFVGVLAGEEPVDYLQKLVLRSGKENHPLVLRIMQIHVAEEARHIGFAHQFLTYRAPKLNKAQRFTMSIAMPVVMRWLCDAIMKPSKKMRRDLEIPDSVVEAVLVGQRTVAKDPARHVRRRANACRRTGPDDPAVEACVADAEDRRPPVALPQRTQICSGLKCPT